MLPNNNYELNMTGELAETFDQEVLNKTEGLIYLRKQLNIKGYKLINNVKITSNNLEKLKIDIDNVPIIESLTVCNCKGLKTIQINDVNIIEKITLYNLPKLNKVEITAESPIIKGMRSKEIKTKEYIINGIKYKQNCKVNEKDGQPCEMNENDEREMINAEKIIREHIERVRTSSTSLAPYVPCSDASLSAHSPSAAVSAGRQK